MSDHVLTIKLSNDKLNRLRRKYPQMRDEEALACVVDEYLGTTAPGEQDTEGIVARLHEQFPDDPLVALIGIIDVPVDESPAEHHDKYALGSDL
jgi:hypothetical protein